MNDLRDPRERQRFLQERIAQNLQMRQMRKQRGLPELRVGDDNFYKNLIDLFETRANKSNFEIC